MTEPRLRFLWAVALGLVCGPQTGVAPASEFRWQVRSQQASDGGERFTRTSRSETWPASRTAFIVCDVWDKHHSLNAVQRLAEFAPRLNRVLHEARRRGAIIIHSPSDCMPAYEQHPARKRVGEIPQLANAPEGIADWCSRIPSEELAAWPVDQSDGGDDDEAAEHARWAAELQQLGRNPALPWQAQSPVITIDPERDLITDRGDEVWRILQHHGIENVVLTGVHTNMCVLGRPFGLRQMVRQGRQVVLMRDMTDCMYNPQRWPFVDHFTGNDLVISHVERFVCPTVTSDQVIGGETFRFRGDTRPVKDVMSVDVPQLTAETLRNQWSAVPIPSRWADVTGGQLEAVAGVVWYRCTVIVAAENLSPDVKPMLWVTASPLFGSVQAWVNGHALEQQTFAGINFQYGPPIVFPVSPRHFRPDEANLVVLRFEGDAPEKLLLFADQAPRLLSGDDGISLKGRWQVRLGDDPEWCNMPLPARFGTPTDIVYELKPGSRP